ncbi:NAD binding 9 domain containing protein [Sulfitobacter noctilucicola]|uniref:Putative NAD(P)/FAD-binding protein YdhS n=1 Tax=Sulfitobacter noctilucicola TaxID=1342301 RepID=A0A7W6Q574_9RHOB|nr:FAD/NAD(P)-binding domain-containing protein [Sulfitobacter noctilucicola]KIN63537.1 NAD binding 9 domain containing protein [Sulfitobacter noctilucicola]MBB4174954.1 putative NAD(P)/FAD-binding protein YdhS [Sulfitobacter noctilucicola]
MNEQVNQSRLAIIGMGPRGLGALEALAMRVEDGAAPLKVDAFDPFPAFGAGPNFDPDEPAVCQLNIPMRDVEIRPPKFARCGSFAEWLEDAPGPNAFPARADLGRYLEERYADLKASRRLEITLSSTKVSELKQVDEGWMLRVADEWVGPYAEVLLSPGQPDVEPDDQLAEWQQHADASHGTLAQSYPAKRLLSQATAWSGRTVAIRGLALSAFDVLRVLTTLQGGKFHQGKYLPSGNEPACILPFSLDGRPPFPKPETEAIDANFEPEHEETWAFSDNIKNAATAAPKRAQEFITEALLPVVARILRDVGGDADTSDVADWLETEWSSPGSQETGGSLETLQAGIAMAEGKSLPSIGYVVGQVWRKWQDELRSGYNPAETPPETAEKIVAFDEGLKRYSYGPPVSSSRELAALIDAGLVDLDYAADPDFALTNGGWTLKNDASSIEADVMIDAVLPSPNLSILRPPLLVGLMEAGRLSPIADSLAAHTAGNGQLIGKDGAQSRGLCLLGRLALGSVVAADSLHDCFGEASHRWAEGVMERLGPRT